MIGTKLAHYEITGHLGSGGMGEVYQASDLKLGRSVAVKFLPEAFSHDSERVARFEREARVLASLNHPGIAAIYGLEEINKRHFLVMELVPGETLADRIKSGAIPLAEALPIVKQIAEALEEAHEKGVIHRDLKPANIKVTPDGKVKVLDFGLAKAYEPEQRGVTTSNSPTVMSMGATNAGVILGTAAYMSPEQARGRELDKRTDIWAFGCVLYEMLTGRPVFTGEDVTEILAAVIHKDPDFAKIPPELGKLLRACLQKDPKQRLRDMGDAAQLLDRETTPIAAPRPAPSKLGWIAGGTMAALAALFGFGYYHAKRPAPLKPLVRLDVDLGQDLPNSLMAPNVILSPDGSRVVFVSNGRLFTRRLEESQPHEMQGTNGASAPFFSPDGQWVAFFAVNKLKKVAVNGGAPVEIADFVGIPPSGTWGENGDIIADSGADVLRKIPESGGVPVPIAKFAPGEGAQKWPQLLPGAKIVLFTSNPGRSGFDGAKLLALRLADGARKTLVEGATFGRYVPASPEAGHLIYVSGSTLFAAPFRLESLELAGPHVAMVEHVAYSTFSGAAQLDISQDGTLVYQTSDDSDGLQTISWIDAAGQARPLYSKPGIYQQLRFSPDGKRLAYRASNSRGADLFIFDTVVDREIRIPFAGGYPVFTSDGKYVAFVKAKDGIWWSRADGSSEPQRLLPGSAGSTDIFSFAPGSKFLAFQRQEGQTAPYHAWFAPIEEDDSGLRAGKPELLVPSGVEERHPAFSPDGKWFAYSSRESGVFEVYVRAFPDRGRKWQVSTSGGVYPEWSQTGELFYRTLDNHVMATAYSVLGDSFVRGQPRQWTPLPIGDPGITFNFALDYAVAPDGKRIAALMPARDSANTSKHRTVVFLQNFSDELKRRVPVN